MKNIEKCMQNKSLKIEKNMDRIVRWIMYGTMFNLTTTYFAGHTTILN